MKTHQRCIVLLQAACLCCGCSASSGVCRSLRSKLHRLHVLCQVAVSRRVGGLRRGSVELLNVICVSGSSSLAGLQ